MNKETILYFVAYFIIYSFVGWILESVYKSMGQRKLVNSGFLIGPVCPIYGTGAILMILTLSSLKNNPILLFISAFFILSILEYVVGFLLEKIFKTKYWDYSNLKFNIKGRVCLKNSIYWGLLGVIFICFINPVVETHIKYIAMPILVYSEMLIGIWMAVDIVISVNEITSFETITNKINELSETIKEKIEDENYMENVIKKLNRKQTKLKIKLYRRAIRMKRAFPSMKSETITTFLNQKIDLKSLKDSIKNKE